MRVCAQTGGANQRPVQGFAPLPRLLLECKLIFEQHKKTGPTKYQERMNASALLALRKEFTQLKKQPISNDYAILDLHGDNLTGMCSLLNNNQ